MLGITRLLDLFARLLIPGDGKQIRVFVVKHSCYDIY